MFQGSSDFIIIILGFVVLLHLYIWRRLGKKKNQVLAASNGLFPPLTNLFIFIGTGINSTFMLKIQSATLSAVSSNILLSS